MGRLIVERRGLLLKRLLAAVAAAMLLTPVLVGPVSAASGTYVANCDTRLRGTASVDATTIDVIASGTSVTATGTVSGGAWSADCGAGVVSGSSWYQITAVGGKSTSSLYGAASVYAATGLFSQVTAPPPPAGMLEGVDVSHWQGAIDYDQVRASGRRFVIAKATEGVGFLDSKWVATKAAVPAAGLRLGGYHFARPDINPSTADAKAEADWFVDNLDLSAGMLVPTLDLEVHGTLSVSALTAWVQAWLGEVYARTGARPMIYVSPSFWRTYLGDTRWFADNGYSVLWVAHWTANASPSVPAANWGGKSWTFWQYADNGTVPGIGGNVDLDRFNGTDLTRVTFGADYKVTLSTASPSLKQGRSGAVAVNLQRNWWTTPVSLSVSGLPASVSAKLGATSTAAAATTLTFATTSATPTGKYAFTVTTTSLGVTRTTAGTLSVTDGIAPATDLKPSFVVGGTIGSTTPVRTSWSASDPSGISAFNTSRRVNNTAWTPQALSASNSTSVTQGLSFSATYRYATRATDGAANSGGFDYGVSFMPLRIQQTSASIHYSSGWGTSSVLSASGGSLRYATAAGAWVSYSFSGSSIGWVAYRGANRGLANVYVDGVFRATVDLYSATASARRIVFVANWSTVGTHSIKIVAKGTSGRPRIDLDAFVRLAAG